MNDSFPPVIDGVANVVMNYARHIEAEHGHAAVVTPAYPGADDAACPFPVLRYPSIDTRKLVGYVAGFPFSPELARQLREENAELLHVHCPMSSALLAREFRDVLQVPLVFTYHTKYDIDIAKAVRSRLLQEGAIRALVQNISACDEVWVVSRGAGENLRSLGYQGDYLVMENGVDVPRERVSDSAVADAVRGYDLPAGVPVFLFVGRLMWYKGLRIILDALAALQAAGMDFRMVVIGDGADGADIRAYASGLGLDGHCIFTGAIRDRDAIRAWYCRADLFLFPSTFDTNGLVVREAAACGLASVLVRDSCAAEGVTDGRNGYLIDENAASLAETLMALCRNIADTHTVGEGAAAELYLSWQDAVSRACARYEVVIDRYRAGQYPRHKRPADELFRTYGELMTALGHVEERGEELEQRIEQTLPAHLIGRLRGHRHKP
ncbi:MAG: glycosyltransferase [Oscillospiraceae bacterium]